jgi:hypothetical protein
MTSTEEQEAIQRDVAKLQKVGQTLFEPTWHHPAASRTLATTVSHDMEAFAAETLKALMTGGPEVAADMQRAFITGLCEWAFELGVLTERQGGLEVVCDDLGHEEEAELHDLYHGWESDEHRDVHGENFDEHLHETDLGRPPVPNPKPEDPPVAPPLAEQEDDSE